MSEQLPFDYSGAYPDPVDGKGPGESGAEPVRANLLERRKKLRPVYRIVMNSAARGVTVKELRERTGMHHGSASGALSNLHLDGHLAKLAEKRDRCGVYVLPEFVNDRRTVPHERNRPKWVREVEVQIEKEVIHEVEVVKEVTVEVPMVVEKEVRPDVHITRRDVMAVIRQWQEDKIMGRALNGLDSLADAMAEMANKKIRGEGK